MFGSTARFGVPSGTSSPFGSPSIFGTTPSGGGGASPVLFGGTNSSTSSFGSSSSTPAFGSGFGVPSGSSSPFGSPSIFGTSTGVFGTNSSSSSFGFNSSAPAFSSGFGLQSSTSTSFGSPSIFGQNNNNNSTTPSIFGGNSTGVFGISSSPFVSKPPAAGSGFGAMFGPFGSSSGFGQNSSTISSGAPVFDGTSSGAFGTNSSSFCSKSPFGAPSHTAFGSPIATSGAPLPPAFGVHSTNPSNFFNQPPRGSKAVVYAPTSVSIDGTNVKLQSISAMLAYKEKCHEELRWEDKGHVAPNPFAPGKSSGIQNPFDQKATPNPFPNPFDQNATPNPFRTPESSLIPNVFAPAPKNTPNQFPVGSSQNPNPFAPAPKNMPNQFPVGTSQFQNPFAPTVPNSTSSLRTTPSTNLFKTNPNPFPPFGTTSAPTHTPSFPSSSSGFCSIVSPTISTPFPPFGTTSAPTQTPSFPSSSSGFFPIVSPSTSTLFPPFGTTSAPTLTPSFPSSSSGFCPIVSPTTSTPFPPFGTTSAPTLTPSFPSSSSGFWSGASPTISTQSPSTQTAHTVGASGGILPNSSSGGGGLQQPAPVMMSPFGALPAMPKLSIGHSGSTPSIQYGISSLPVVDKTPARTRLSSPLISCHHLSQRRPRLPVRKYDPHSDRPKVPFYCNEEATAPLYPRDNPRALVINPAPNFLQRHTASPAPSSDSIEGEDVVDEEGVRDIDALMPKLRLVDYYTEPTIQELATKEKAEPGFIRHVNDFVVGRHGYGSIKFLGETNVEKLELDSVVKFNYREVVVYEEGDEKKPGVGEGLNKAAEVRLLNIKCMGKKSGKQYVDGPSVIEYKQKLVKKANEQGAEFVSYDPVLGEWKFRVQNFS